MTMPTYGELLANPQWQRRRLHMLERAGWMCCRCFETDEQLHVHHKRYVRGRKPWEYADDELLVLCSTCHTREHALMEALHELMRDGMLCLDDVVALVAGYRQGSQNAGCDPNYVRPAVVDGSRGERAYNAGVLAGSVEMLAEETVIDMAEGAVERGQREFLAEFETPAHMRVPVRLAS
jgi:hypothetical protein